MDADQVDLTDLEIVDALQQSPRATWAEISRAVELSEASVSRRWSRLRFANLAWTGVALHPAVTMGAFLEIRCPEAEVEALIAGLARHPDVFTVGQTTGDLNVFAITIATELEGVLSALHGGIPELQAVPVCRTSIFRQVTGGVHWRQGILDARRRSERSAEQPADKAPRPVITPQDRQLFLELGRDGRMPLSEISVRLGRSSSGISRRLKQLLDEQQIVFRADVARPFFDLPLGMVIGMKAPPAVAQEVAGLLGRWRATRFCAGVIAATNIIHVVGLHDLRDADRILDRLQQEHPEVEVLDRRIVTRMKKIYGHVLDERGRSCEVIPVDPWFRTER